MVRKYKRKSNSRNYPSKAVMKQAVEEVRSGMALKTASKTFNIPRTTLRRKIVGNEVRSVGGQTIFTRDQEALFCDRLLYLSERGFPYTVEEVRELAYVYAKTLRRRQKLNKTYPATWDNDKKASEDWWLSFKGRHPDVSLRMAQHLSCARAEAFNEVRVHNFFKDLSATYDRCGSVFPDLIYNCDETGLSSVPNSSKRVVARKGQKTVQKVSVGERGTLTTLLPCINAAGDVLPPFIIFKGSDLPSTSDYPANTKLCASKSGYVDRDLFLLFLKHFQQFRFKQPGLKAVLIFDGHRSHVSIEAIDFAMDNDIELVCIPPHSSHRLQPLDTHFNKSLKTKWSNEIHIFLKSTEKVVLTKYEFHNPFGATWKYMAAQRGLIVDSFQHCGIYPLKDLSKTISFSKATVFHDLEDRETRNDAGPSTSLQTTVRRLMTSPQKTMNARHHSPHHAQITCPDTAKSPLEKARVKPSRPSKRRKLSKSADLHFQEPIACSSTSTFCSVCDAPWISTEEDWLKCTICDKWACESCFNITTCARCS